MNIESRHRMGIGSSWLSHIGTAFVIVLGGLLTINPAGAQESHGCAPATNDLAAWWPFEGDGTEALNGTDAILSGDPTFASGKVGQALVLSDAHDSARANADTVLDIGAADGLTVELWINPTSVSDQQPLIEWSDTTTTTGLHLWHSVWTPYTTTQGGAGSLFANLISREGVAHHVSSAAGLLTANTFQHVALTYDKDNGIARLYLNGVRVAETNVGSFTPETRTDVYFGLRPQDGGVYRFSGALDEVSLFRQVLSEPELLAIYQAGAAGKCSLTSEPPVITTQPQDQTVFVGGTATFSVAARGTAPLSYQWFFNSDPITEATGGTLVLADVEAEQAGSYSVTVSNSFGSVLSSNAMLIVNPPPPCGSASNDLAAWWPFQNDGTELISGATAMLSGGPSFVAAKVSQGIALQDANDSARADAGSALDIGAADGLTVELWINPTSVSHQQPLIEWSDTTATTGLHFWHSVWTPFTTTQGGAGSLFANLISREGVAHHVSSAAGLLKANTFQHVALTYDRISGIARLYLNGVRVAETNVGSFTPETRTDVYFGLRPLGGGAYRFSGVLDEVSFYRRALSDVELLEIYDADAGGKCPASESLTLVHQPQDATVIEGETARFSVSAVGTRPITYQWLFNGQPLTGETSSTLILSGVQSAQAGTYSVIVENPAGTATSSNATLTVNPRPPCSAAPSGLVAWWPLGGNGDEVVFGNEMELNGSPVFVEGYTGQGLAFDGVDDFGRAAPTSALDIGSGEGLTVELWIKPTALERSAALLEWTDDSSTLGVHFYASVWSPFSGGGTGSLFANLIDTAGNAHHVSSSPGILQVGSFQHVALTYDRASGVAQMYLNGVAVAHTNVGSFVPETRTGVDFGQRAWGGLNYRFDGVMDEIALYNRALSTGELAAIYAAGASGKCMTNEPPVILPPIIVSQPESQTVIEGGAAHFSVVARSSAPLSYQWLLGEAELPGATQAVLSIANVRQSDAGQYSIRVSNSAGSVLSEAATLTVSADTRPPVITHQPANQQVTPGGAAAFSVVAVGALPLAYQWRFNGTDIPEATNTTLVVGNVQTEDAGAYSVTITNPFGSVVSADAVLSVTSYVVGGQVVFANRGAGLDAPIFDSDGVTKLGGGDYRVELVGGPTIGTMAVVGPSVPFRSGAAAGYFFGGSRAIPTVEPGATAHVQVRAWDYTKGTNYDQALANGGRAGESTIFTVVTGGGGLPPALPAPLIGLESFSLAGNLVAASVMSTPAVLSPGGIADDGAMTWILRGQRGVVYAIECSINLVDWFPFTSVATPSGTATFKDAPGRQCSYYRARLLR